MTEETLLQAVMRQLDSAARSSDGIARPAALLWPDPERQWIGLMPQLRVALPQLFTLGAYDPETKSGPAIWLRCVIDRTVAIAPDDGVTPIFYLPDIARQHLRAVADCATTLQPLVELQYRGATWHQRNGREWTVEAFLLSILGLDPAQDTRTREALLRALPRLVDVDLSALRGRRLDADDFDGLAVGDPIRDALRWMSSPKAFRAATSDTDWASFVSICRSSLQFSPDDDDVTDAATKLAEGGGKWDQVWSRFCDSPRLYSGVASALRTARHSLITADRDPSKNDAREKELRRELEATLMKPHAEACAHVGKLASVHASRCDSVWAHLGHAPFAVALEPLARLASCATRMPNGSTADEAAADYAEEGWRCDRAMIDALASPVSSSTDRDVIAKVAHHLYASWAEAAAQRFQQLMASMKKLEVIREGPGYEGTCVLFVDGLRLDLGVALLEKLHARGLSAYRKHRIAPLPTVTPTAKPATVPLVGAFRGGDEPIDFNPVFAGTREPVIAPKLREAMRAKGVTVLDAEDVRGPDGEESIGWIEVGELDEKGHSLGIDLVRHIDEELDRIAEQVDKLATLGWRVRVVTDHGWLLLPGGLPKHQLPAYLTESKWSRCAAVKRGTKAVLDTYGWHWDPYVAIVSPPGIHAFKAGQQYAHGGISLQECVVPEINVSRKVPVVIATIRQIEWRGMRCRVTVANPAPGLRVDVRTNRKNATSTVAANVKDLIDGRADVVVPDDADEGKAVSVVLLDSDGSVVDHQSTTIGGEA